MHEGLDRHLGVNEAESGWFGSFTQVVRDELVDVPVGLLTRDNRLDLHPRTPEATRRRVRARVHNLTLTHDGLERLLEVRGRAWMVWSSHENTN